MVISFASKKAGTGKTSPSIPLSAGLARKGNKGLLIDLNSQANSSKVLLPEYQKIPKEQTICTTIIERKPLTVHKRRCSTALCSGIGPPHLRTQGRLLEAAAQGVTNRRRVRNSKE